MEFQKLQNSRNLKNLKNSFEKFIMRLKCFLGFEEGKVLSNFTFNYCPLVWSVHHQLILCLKYKICKNERFSFIDNDYSSSYEELLKSLEKTTINVCNPVDTRCKLNVHKTFNLRPVSAGNYLNLCIEILITLNNINPNFVR